MEKETCGTISFLDVLNVIGESEDFAKTNPRSNKTVFHILSNIIADSNTASVFDDNSLTVNRRAM